jgi:hypothetical protein
MNERLDFKISDKPKKKEKAIEDLDKIYKELRSKYLGSEFDFPKIDEFKDKLKEMDWTKLKKSNKGLIKKASKMIDKDLPRLVKLCHQIDGNVMTKWSPLKRAS